MHFRASGDPEHWAEVDELIDKVTPYMEVSSCVIDTAKKYGRMIEIKSNSLSKAFAAIAMVQLGDRVDWDCVKKAVNMSAPVPQVTIMERKVSQYRCNKCGQEVAEAYMVRKHPCQWGKKKRKRC